MIFEVPTTDFGPFFSQTVKITSGTILLKNKIDLELIIQLKSGGVLGWFNSKNFSRATFFVF